MYYFPGEDWEILGFCSDAGKKEEVETPGKIMENEHVF